VSAERFDLDIRPEPGDEDRAAILAAVQEVLQREALLAQPAVWTLAGWTERRIGIDDLGSWIPADRRWALSARMPRGGRVFPGLYGRGDAK
jgi:hypothetical protein